MSTQLLALNLRSLSLDNQVGKAEETGPAGAPFLSPTPWKVQSRENWDAFRRPEAGEGLCSAWSRSGDLPSLPQPHKYLWPRRVPLPSDRLTSCFCTKSRSVPCLSAFKLLVRGSRPLLSVLSHSGKGGGTGSSFPAPHRLQQLAPLSSAAPRPPRTWGPCPLPPARPGPAPKARPQLPHLSEKCVPHRTSSPANLATCFRSALMALRSPTRGQT